MWKQLDGYLLARLCRFDQLAKARPVFKIFSEDRRTVGDLATLDYEPGAPVHVFDTDAVDAIGQRFLPH